ncbi:MAG: hypothetical protein U0S48_09590 [Solirubrobacteraceae bacterium]
MLASVDRTNRLIVVQESPPGGSWGPGSSPTWCGSGSSRSTRHRCWWRRTRRRSRTRAAGGGVDARRRAGGGGGARGDGLLTAPPRWRQLTTLPMRRRAGASAPTDASAAGRRGSPAWPGSG